jgi:hypothetical protein
MAFVSDPSRALDGILRRARHSRLAVPVHALVASATTIARAPLARSGLIVIPREARVRVPTTAGCLPPPGR